MLCSYVATLESFFLSGVGAANGALWLGGVSVQLPVRRGGGLCV